MGSIPKSLCGCGIALIELSELVEQKAFDMYFSKMGYRGIEELLVEVQAKLDKDDDGSFMLKDRLDCPAKFRAAAIEQLKIMLDNRGVNTADELYDMAMSLSSEFQHEAIEQFKNACAYIPEEPA